jgi:hypothetical protein
VTREQVVKIYIDILDGKIKRFPNNFFIGEEGTKYIRFMTRYLLEDSSS